MKSQLYGEASQCIAGLQITNTNYAQAIHILVQRFGQEHKIVNAYMQNLLNLPSPTSGLNGLKAFYGTMESYIRGLEALGKAQESYGSMLVPIMLGKLPGHIRQNITRDHGNDKWDLYSLREALRREICIQEAGREVRTNEEEPDFTSSTAVYVTSVQENRTDTCDVKDIRNKPCVFCGGIHAPFFCNNVKNVEDRKRIVKEKRLCYNCLGGRHRIVNCKSENVCKKCGQRHHTSICTKNKLHTGAQNKRENDERNLDTSAYVKYMHSDKSSAETEVLLKTAIAPVSSDQRNYKDGNILFDEGAQKGFITEELAGKLHIISTKEEKIETTGFGVNGTSKRNLRSARIYVQGKKSEVIPIDVLIVPKIANPIKTHRNVTTGLTYLKGLTLAHPTTHNENFEISLLIGADWYWDFIDDNVIRGNGPTAVKSKLGYVLSGPTQVRKKT